MVDSPNFPHITAHEREQNVLAAEHVAHLGAELFGRHLIAVEVAGTLLLIALVGATAIVSAVRQSSGANPQHCRPARRQIGDRPIRDLAVA